MADSYVLTDGTLSITLASFYPGVSGSKPLRIGPVDNGRQTVTLDGAQIIGSTVDNLFDRYTALEQMLHDAQSFRAQGLGRRVTLTILLNGASLATTYYVRSGVIPPPPIASTLIQQLYLGPFTLEMDVEPFGRGAEATLVNATGILRPRNHITHRYVNHTGGTLFSVNLTAQTRGPLWQSTKFAVPPTAVTPAAADKLYFGSTLAIFDRLILGLSTAAAGITWGAWEYWNGSAWTTFVPSSNSFLTGANQLGVAASMGEVIWATLAGWAATTINGVSAFWVRLNVTSVSGPTTPVLVNGPIRSLAEVAAITAADVKGDVPALGLVYLKNNEAIALGGVRAALATSQLGSPAPPFHFSLLSARTFVPTTGDNTVAIGTDAEASVGERVEAALSPSYTDAAQTFDGASERASVTLVSADKIDQMAGQSFFIEVAFSVDTDVTRPMPLCTRWDQAGSNRIWGLWVDDMRLRGMASSSGTNRMTVNGNRRLKRRHRYLGTLEFDSTKRRLNLYLNGQLEASRKLPTNTIRRNQTTAMRVAESVSFAAADSRNGQDTEDFFDGIIDWIMLYGDRVEDFRNDVLGGGEYNFPNDAANDVARTDSSEVRALYQMNDNVASTTIVDSAILYNGTTKNLVRSTGNTSTNRRPGVFSAGIGSFARLVAGDVPRCFIEEYAGTYRILMAARPAVALGELDDLAFLLQLNAGDSRLQTGPPAYFPSIAVPPSSGYYLLDMGTFTLPPASLYDGHRGSGSAANFVEWSLFVQHKYTSTKTFYLDNFYFLPTDTWYAEYDTFDDHYESTVALAQNEGLAWDARGPRPLVYQTTSAGLLVQRRNPYAVPVPTAPRFHPKKSATLFAMGLRGDASTDVLYRILGDCVVPTVRAIPRFRTLVGS